MWWCREKIHLDVSVHMPRSLFAIVHWFHWGVSQASDISSCKHPGLAGLHGVCVHLWSPPAGQLHRIHCFYHCTHTTYTHTQIKKIKCVIFRLISESRNLKPWTCDLKLTGNDLVGRWAWIQRRWWCNLPSVWLSVPRLPATVRPRLARCDRTATQQPGRSSWWPPEETGREGTRTSPP